jgi:energy-coupling factor transporter transmembrane protein EcfT
MLFIGCIFAVVAIFIACYWSIYLMGYDDPHPRRVLLTVFLLLATFVLTLAAAVAMLTSAFISFYRKQFRLGSSRVVLCLTLILITFMALLFLRWATPFARGFRAKVAASVNIEQLTGWATDQFQRNSNGNTHIVIYPNKVIDVRGGQAMINQIKPPDALKEIGGAFRFWGEM